MPTRTLVANRSSLFAGGSSNLGGGADDHLPIGSYSGYTFRSAVRFAMDWSGVKAVTRATLHLRVTSQVHLAFSSAPDIQVRRAVADWSANSASGSADGGGGWSTSPTAYPGPTVTDTGKATKRSSTTAGAVVDVDITAIVRAWAPAYVDGGAAAANYGVRIDAVDTGSDRIEYNSYRASSGKPTITLEYTTDTAPVATVTGPTGTVSTVRPTITGNASDADGDAIEQYDVEVRKAAAVVYAPTNLVGASLAHVPTADLPSGALTVRIRARANGVYGAWTAEAPFLVDRPPVLATWASPVGNVTGTRRPVHSWTMSDPDADTPVELWDLEVYAASAGAPVGAPVYAVYNNLSGIAGLAVSHTPAADLPSGPLVARVRARTGPGDLYSAWSAYQPYTVVTAVPAITFIVPAQNCGFLYAYEVDMADLAKAPTAWYRMAEVRVEPPAGQTITNVKVTRTPLWPTPGGAAVDYNGPHPVSPSGGTWRVFVPAAGINAATVRLLIEATASGAGTAALARDCRHSFGEWIGSAALGDQATALAIGPPTVKGADVQAFLRAQSSPSAAAGSAPWRAVAAIATVEGELPTTNAYIGLRARFAMREVDRENVTNPGFDDGTTTGWQTYVAGSFGAVPDVSLGSPVLRVAGIGTTNGPALIQSVPVLPGARYTGLAWMYGGTRAATVAFDARRADGSAAAFDVISLSQAPAAWARKSGVYDVPSDGSVVALSARIGQATGAGNAIGTDVVYLDQVNLIGPVPGAAGLDRWSLAWRSLG